MWFATFVYWLVSSFSVKKSVKKQSEWERILYILCVLLAFSLLFGNYFNFLFLDKPILPQNDFWKVTGMILCAAGLIFAIMARIWLGENWSGRITIKVNHELIQTGPYAITRNPIYSGFLLAFSRQMERISEPRNSRPIKNFDFRSVQWRTTAFAISRICLDSM